MKINTHFPQPSGSYKIGKIHLNFVDDQRIDPFPLAAEQKRQAELERQKEELEIPRMVIAYENP